jgi:hypothetical protein
MLEMHKGNMSIKATERNTNQSPAGVVQYVVLVVLV